MTTNYNPMSKEFREEYKRLGLTGCQLTDKYRKEGKYLEKGTYKRNRDGTKYTEKELLDHLIQFYKKCGRVPTQQNFHKNHEYPSYVTYINHFGSWSNALKLVGMDLDTIIIQENLENNIQKGRYSEIKVMKHFIQRPIDLAGGNHNNHCDGICPNGKTYEVKSSKFYIVEEHYRFGTNNKFKEEIEIYYLLGFNKDYTKLEYVWRVPGEIVEKNSFYVGLNRNYEFNIVNMKEYDITNKFKELNIS